MTFESAYIGALLLCILEDQFLAWGRCEDDYVRRQKDCSEETDKLAIHAAILPCVAYGGSAFKVGGGKSRLGVGALRSKHLRQIGSYHITVDGLDPLHGCFLSPRCRNLAA